MRASNALTGVVPIGTYTCITWLPRSRLTSCLSINRRKRAVIGVGCSGVPIDKVGSDEHRQCHVVKVYASYVSSTTGSPVRSPYQTVGAVWRVDHRTLSTCCELSSQPCAAIFCY